MVKAVRYLEIAYKAVRKMVYWICILYTWKITVRFNSYLKLTRNISIRRDTLPNEEEATDIDNSITICSVVQAVQLRKSLLWIFRFFPPHMSFHMLFMVNLVEMSGDSTFRQEMPPPGGYRKFNFARTFPKLVWRPGVVVATAFGVAVYGSFEGIRKKKANITEKFEDVDINNAMQPFLTAERDRYWLKLLKKNRDLEDEIMKDVPGWKTEPYLKDMENYWRHHSEYSAPKFYDKWIPKSIARYIW
ncbi:GRIM-19 protein [Dictyocaulus viviparus]|uniref:NADH dehydrogenase [ubiquinone] 1 alpha subcomplex subunit 13 n=1 Tax=Dictyocaulus viviparus TaxID=29172 RepID=A0A0D8Y810_DICVI|nr:GRIM-19 protein [Dictyocaulus viviparus]